MTITHLDPTIEVHETPGGKLAIKATSGDLSTTKYAVGGYWYYAISARVAASHWDAKTRDIVREPRVEIEVHKRTRSLDVARKAARKHGASVFVRRTNGEYEERV